MTDLRWREKNDKSLEIDINQSDGSTAQDTSGWTFYFEIYHNDSLVLQKTTSGSADGEDTIEITDENLTIDPKYYDYLLRAETAAGTRYVIQSGKLKILDEYTDETETTSAISSTFGGTTQFTSNLTISAGSNITSLLDLPDVEGPYVADYFLKINSGGTGVVVSASSAVASWGTIIGTLSNQTDLQNALNAKQNSITDSDDISEGTTNLFLTTIERSKLSSIEANADVTDTANVTAAGALMDSEVTNLAQVKSFDSSNYATAAQGTLADSALQSGDNISELTNDAGYITATLTAEQVQDYVGAMFSTNTETFITATYQDTDGTIDLVVPVLDEDDMSSNSANHLATQQSIKAYVDAQIGGGGYTDEQAQDAVGTILTDSSEIDFTYDDVTPQIYASIVTGSIDVLKLDAGVQTSLSLADSALQSSDNISELTNDSGYITESSVSTLTNKSGNISQWTNDSGYITSTLTEEQVEDYVGGMLTGNTATLITVTYQDTDGTIDFVVDSDLHNFSWTNVDATDLKVGSITQAYDANLPTWPSTVSATEVGYLDGVTSAIQTQLNAKLANVAEDTTPQLGGDLDENGKGFTIEATAGESVVAGDICYLKSDGKFWKADASAESTTKGMIAMCLDTISSDGTGTFMTRGSWTTSGLTAGGEYFVSETAGGKTTTAPSTSASIVRVVGYAISTTVFYFDPDKTYVENA